MNIIYEGKSIYYTDEGSGHPVVFLHGWGSDMSAFGFFSKPLVSEGYRVIMIDLPGHGKSEEPPRPYSVEDMARAVLSVISSAEVEKPTLVGHSNGGRIIIKLTAQMGYEAKSLVLMDSAGIIPKRGIEYKIKVASYKLGKKLILAFGGKNKEEKLEAFKKKRGSADYRGASGVMRDTMVKIVNEDLEPVLPKISVPTLLLWGKDDTATPISDGKKMNALIKGSGLFEMEGGHWAFAQSPSVSLAAVLCFLKS